MENQRYKLTNLNLNLLNSDIWKRDVKFDTNTKFYDSDKIYLIYAKNLKLVEIMNILINELKVIKKIKDSFVWNCTNSTIFININNINKTDDFDLLYSFVYNLNYEDGKKNKYDNHIILIHKESDKIYIVNNIIITHKKFISDLLNSDVFNSLISPFIDNVEDMGDIKDINKYLMEVIRLIILNLVLPQRKQNIYENVIVQLTDWMSKSQDHKSKKSQSIHLIGNLIVLNDYKHIERYKKQIQSTTYYYQSKRDKRMFNVFEDNNEVMFIDNRKED